jgi:hypothetical protein
MLRVTVQEDGGLVKKILAVGEGYECPETGDEVTGKAKRSRSLQLRAPLVGVTGGMLEARRGEGGTG